MATIVLQAVGTAVGTALGGPIGGTIGAAIGSAAGSYIDAQLFAGGKDQHYEGPRLESLQVLTSTQGSAIARTYGRVRIGGQIIWATNLEEVVTKKKQKSGGKGGGPKTTTTEYSYYANFAVGLCEGEVGYLNRIWADGKEVDLASIDYRFYTGSGTQSPDSLIESVEGADKAPAYRGLSYVVFDRLALENFGNRIPQMAFEIVRPSPSRELEKDIAGINLIPAATEFGYDPEVIDQTTTSSSGKVTGRKPENTHTKTGKSDWTVSLDQMDRVMPNVKSVCLVVSWFFDDLRCGECEVRPRVENTGKKTTPHSWRVSGVTRGNAPVVSYVGTGSEARPAFGGTPNDASVIRAIRDLKARGYEVMLYPFIMGDVPSGNGKPDPYGGGEQATFPWRGRITCHPAAGQAGSPDGTAAAAVQVDAFVGTATASQFSTTSDAVNYSGPNEWSYRRFILHLAGLAKAAGGVESFCVGSEMVNMTTVRSSSNATTGGVYPFVDALVNLLPQVRSLVGASTKLGYAADWSEYHSHRPPDGSGDVFFNMDKLWSNANLDFIGIDNYFPLADWRGGTDHLDYDREAGHTTPYELDYLKSNIEGGEYYDWYYASNADRLNQVRTPISGGPSNGAGGFKTWVFRQKDIRNWWSNAHVNYIGGVERSASGWVAASKPVWFTEVGCPALDKAANQPNVFYDPKSSESALPYFSTGARDDVIQRRYIQAVQEYWHPSAGNNPAGMIDVDRLHVWSWDARPFPSWPLDATSWGDASNWQYGHWLSSRMGTVYVPDLMRHIANDYGFSIGEFERAYGSCDGYVIDRTMSLRDALSPLGLAFFFDLIESGATIKAITRRSTPLVLSLDADRLVDSGSMDGGDEGAEVALLKRSQETELPKTVRLKFLDSERAYASSAVQSTRDGVRTTGVSEIDLPLIIDEPRAQAAADLWLADAWASRETGSFTLLPSAMALEVGDVVRLSVGGLSRDLRLTNLTDGDARQSSATTFVDTQLSAAPPAIADRTLTNPTTVSYPTAVFMDLPLLTSGLVGHAGYVAVSAEPWPGQVSVFRSATESNWTANTVATQPAIIGETLSAFGKGPCAVWDRATSFEIELYDGELSSVDRLTLLGGDNAFAVQTATGEWEILQARDIELLGPNYYRLSMLLRGQRGTEHAMGDVPIGSPIVFLDEAVEQVSMSLDDIGVPYYWRYGPVGQPIGADTFTTTQQTFNAVGLRPFSPVHIRVSEGANGDAAISWIRRTRTDGDSWAINVPLGEDVEAYEIEFLNSAESVVRTVEINTPSFTYTSAMRTADVGAGGQYSLRVYQVSAVYGRGTYSRWSVGG